MAAKQESQLVTVGRIGAVYGVRGGVRIHSFTAPPEQIFEYQPWWLKTSGGLQSVELSSSQVQGTGLVAQLKGLDDREQARRLAQAEIMVDAGNFPELEPGEYYWHQLEGLRVISEYDGKRSDLGRVSRLMETGANDVLVVKGDGQSIDKRERLVPYLPEQTVKHIDLTAGEMLVDWDPEF